MVGALSLGRRDRGAVVDRATGFPTHPVQRQSIWEPDAGRGVRHAELVLGYLREFGTAGNLTTDTHLAALAVEYQAILHTTDADFARFRGLRWKNPLA